VKFFILFLIFFSHSFSSEAVVSVSETDVELNITKHIKILKGPNLETAKPVTLYNGNEIKLGYSTDTNWIYFDIENIAKNDLERYVYFNNYLTGVIELYTLTGNDEWKLLDKTGSMVPPGNRALESLYTPFKVTLPKDKISKFLIKRTSKHRLDAHLLLSSSDKYTNKVNEKFTLILLYVGAIIALGIYNFFIAIFSRENIYFLYCGFVFSMSATITTLLGFSDYTFSFLSFPISTYLMVFTCLSVIFGLCFAEKFLEIKKYAKALIPVFRTFLFLAAVHLILGLSGVITVLDIHAGMTVDIVTSASVLLMLIAGVVSTIKGSIMARFYLGSWVFIFISTFLWFGMNYGLFPRTFITTYSLLFGNLAEMLFIALGLAFKISILDKKIKRIEIQAEDKEKYQRLMRALCHDIANSLFIITGFTKRFLKRPEELNSTKNWQKIARAAENMRLVLASVRDQEAIQSQHANIKLTTVCLSEVFKESKFIFEDKLQAKNINLISEIEHSGCKVIAEKTTLLHNVINNILSNAIKFSKPNNDILISKNSDDKYHSIVIRDYGVGIEKESLARIKKQQDVLSTLGTDGELGTGYGMSMMHSYMKLYKGMIEINSWSKVNGHSQTGTEIILYFPVN